MAESVTSRAMRMATRTLREVYIIRTRDDRLHSWLTARAKGELLGVVDMTDDGVPYIVWLCGQPPQDTVMWGHHTRTAESPIVPYTVDQCRTVPYRTLENAVELGVCRVRFDDIEEAKRFYKQIRALAYYGRGKHLDCVVRRDAETVSVIKDMKHLPSAEFV